MIQEHQRPQEMGNIELNDSPLRDRKAARHVEILPPSPDSQELKKDEVQEQVMEKTNEKEKDTNPINDGAKDSIKIEEDRIASKLVELSEESQMDKTQHRIRNKRIKKTLRKSQKPTMDQTQMRDTIRVDIGTQTKRKDRSSSSDFDFDKVSSKECQKCRPLHYNIKSYEEKLKIVRIANAKGVNFAAQKYHVSINNIHRWRVSCARRPGAGRKISDPFMQAHLIDWIREHMTKYGAIPQRREIRSKAKEISATTDFQASKGWYERFLDRNPQFKDLPRLRSSRRYAASSKMDSQSQTPMSLLSANVYMQPEVKQEHVESSKPKTEASELAVKLENAMIDE